MPGLLHPDGEIGIARAAERVGAMYTLSTMASRSIEDVAASTSGPQAFQLYLFRDRTISLELLHRAHAARYQALILTIDWHLLSTPARDRTSGLTHHPQFTPRTIHDLHIHPSQACNVPLRSP